MHIGFVLFFFNQSNGCGSMIINKNEIFFARFCARFAQKNGGPHFELCFDLYQNTPKGGFERQIMNFQHMKILSNFDNSCMYIKFSGVSADPVSTIPLNFTSS